MSQLLQLRAAVIAAIQAALPGFEVAGHLGRFSASDLGQFLVKAPAVRVAVLGLSNARALGEDGDHLAADVKVAIFVVTKDQGVRLGREEAAVAAVERLCLLATGARWGLAFARPAEPPTAQTLFNDATLAKGVALWAIDLTQSVVLSPAEAGEVEGGPLSELWLGVAPNVGAAHRDDYLGPFDRPSILDLPGRND